MVGIEIQIVAAVRAVLALQYIFFRVCGLSCVLGARQNHLRNPPQNRYVSPCSSGSSSRTMSATPTIRRRHNCRSLRSRSGLIKYAHNNTSQNGEDGIIDRLFDVLLPPSQRRYCVDVGAWDGMHLVSSHNAMHTGNLVVWFCLQLN
jgi:hypothetical protein